MLLCEPRKVYIRNMGSQVLVMASVAQNAKSSVRRATLLVNSTNNALSPIQAASYRLLHPHLWRVIFPTFMAVKNDYTLIYRGLCFQIGNGH